MPSSYSGNLLLELMADGENDGLWGDITNENLEILGRAISGVTTVSLAGTTHTLTVTQGTLSEGHYQVLELGGSPTGTNTITVDPNTVARVYFVKNGSGQDAVFTQGSGGNVTVANGDSAIVYCDGGGASAKVTELTADFLRGVNNLSDLADAATALTNLGLTATAAEINKLDGATLDLAAVTATAPEVNVLDGSTATTDDLNKLAAVTATAAELNTLDDINTAGNFGLIPSGGIIMWSGTIATIPSGWALCDGTNGTPDLTGRFIVHADADSGGTYAPGATGGADDVTLTEAQMPSHTHGAGTLTTDTPDLDGSFEIRDCNLSAETVVRDRGIVNITSNGNSTAVLSTFGVVKNRERVTVDATHSHTITGTAAATGGGSAHENRPPYYALAFIQKL